jgi:hypothetical protein
VEVRPEVKEPGSSRKRRLWDEIEVAGLRLVGFATMLAGGVFLYIALGFGTRTGEDSDLRILSGLVGIATVLAGLLAVARLREDLVGSMLGGFTAAAFTIGAAQTTQPNAGWGVFFPAAIFGGLLVGFLALRGAFRVTRVRGE